METLKPQPGDRVWAARTIRNRNRTRTIYRNTPGIVLDCRGHTATIQWEDESIFLTVPITALTRQRRSLLPSVVTQPHPLAAWSVTELRRFESIQALLTRLGYADLQHVRAMVNPVTSHVIDFDKIAGRSVAEFVRWGLEIGWLHVHVSREAAD